MAFGEEARQHASERVLFVEKSHAPAATRLIAALGQGRHDVRRVEDAGLRRNCFAALEPRGEQSRMRAGRNRRRQKPGEEGMVRGVSEIARRVALLPGPSRQQGGQIRRPPFRQSVARHVVAQRVQRDEKRVVRSDKASGVKHPFNLFSHRLSGFGLIHYIRFFTERRRSILALATPPPCQSWYQTTKPDAWLPTDVRLSR